MTFVPSSSAATTVSGLRAWVSNELIRLGNAIAKQSQEIRLPVTHSAPDKPQIGQIVFADGTNWNPGGGRGLYLYDSAWSKIN